MDILKNSRKVYKVPKSWQFSEKLFTEAATAGALYKSCSENFVNFLGKHLRWNLFLIKLQGFNLQVI